MAQIVEELLVFKVSRLVKDNASVPELINDEIKDGLIEAITATLENNGGYVVVEAVDTTE